MTPTPSRRGGPAAASKTAKRGAGEGSLRWVVWMTLFMVAVTLGAIFFVVPIMVQDYRDATVLKARGVATTARAVGIVEHPGSARSAPTYTLDFVFRIAALPRPITDQADITTHEAKIVRIPSSVPIVYDPLRHSLAALNLHDKVHRRHPLIETIGWMALLFVILATAWAGQIVLLVSTLRERRARHGR